MKRWFAIVGLVAGLFSSLAWSVEAPAPMPRTTVLVWANEAVMNLYAYDYLHYATQLQGVSDYFTTDAWKTYTEALAKAKTLDTVRDNKLNVSAVAIKPPVIKDAKAITTGYQWTIEMPTLIQYDSSTMSKQQKVNITMVVVTAAAPQGVRGLAIQSFIAKPME